MPEPSPTFLQDALQRGQGVFVSLEGHASLVRLAGEIASGFDGGKAGRATFLLFVLKTEQARSVLGAAKGLMGEPDRRKLGHIDKGVSAAASCGGMVATAILTGLTGGAAIALFALNAAVCAKDLYNWYSMDAEGQGLFDRSPSWKAAGLGLDATALVTSLFAGGAKSLFKITARRGLPAIGRTGHALGGVEKFELGSKTAGLVFQGAEWIVDAASRSRGGARPATRDDLEALLQLSRHEYAAARYVEKCLSTSDQPCWPASFPSSGALLGPAPIFTP